MKITVYSKPACQQCTATKRWLTQHGLEFAEEDITEPVNLESVKSLGYLEAPVVMVVEGEKETHWSGFRPDQLSTLIN